MIGRIKSLITSNRAGFIQADDGQTVYFNWSSVWEHDLSFLAVGHPVSFELQSGHWPKASNVHLFMACTVCAGETPGASAAPICGL